MSKADISKQHKEFIAKLEEIRHAKGLGVIDFSKVIFGNSTYYSSYLKNVRHISLNAMIKVAESLGQSLDIYLGDKLKADGEKVTRPASFCNTCPITEYMACGNEDPDHCTMRGTIRKFVVKVQEGQEDNRGRGGR